MAVWDAAPEVELLARALIKEHHTRLAGAKIAYLFREGKWTSQDRTTWARTYKVSDRDNFLTGYDFYIVINREVWRELIPSQRYALLDHELSHCGTSDTGEWCIWGHDVEDFCAVVRRHGPWSEGVTKYLAAAEKRKEQQGQLALFSQPKEPQEPEPEEKEEAGAEAGCSVW